MAKRNVPAQSRDNLPAQSDLMDRMREQAGVGLDTIGAKDILIPRTTILQGLSPQVTQGRPEYDPNARVGQIYDVGLKEAFPSGIRVVIAYYTKVWNEWAPRQTGRGILRAHPNDRIMNMTQTGPTGQPTLPNGNIIQETAEFYCLNLTARGRKIFIPMTSTQLKEARRINTYITSEEVTDRDGNTFRPPIFYRTYDLTTVATQNAKGSWLLWKCDRGPLLSEMKVGSILFDEALRFRSALVKGEARGDMSEDGVAGASPTPEEMAEVWDDKQDPPQHMRRNAGPL